MTLKIKLLIITIALVISGYFVWQTQTFQKAAFPVKHWTNRVESLKQVIKFNNTMISSATRDLYRIKGTARLDVQDMVDSNELLGVTKQKAREMAVKNIQEDIDANFTLIKELRAQNKIWKRDLLKARIELSKHQ